MSYYWKLEWKLAQSEAARIGVFCLGRAGHPHALRARVLSFVLLACLLPNVELDVGEDNAEDHDAHEEQQLAQRVLAQAVAEDLGC